MPFPSAKSRVDTWPSHPLKLIIEKKPYAGGIIAIAADFVAKTGKWGNVVQFASIQPE